MDRRTDRERDRDRQTCTNVNHQTSLFDNLRRERERLLEFSKAFDKVPHRRLAAKLHHYGVNMADRVDGEFLPP